MDLDENTSEEYRTKEAQEWMDRDLSTFKPIVDQLESKETPNMKLTNAQRLQLNSAYDTLTRLKILAGDIDDNDLAVAADNLQNIIDEL